MSSDEQSNLEFNTNHFHVGALAGLQFDWENSLSPLNPVSMYASFTNSINDGILKHHIVAPGAAVNGYIYYQIPMKPGESIQPSFSRLAGYKYQIELKTDTGIKLIEFLPR